MLSLGTGLKRIIKTLSSKYFKNSSEKSIFISEKNLRTVLKKVYISKVQNKLKLHEDKHFNTFITKTEKVNYISLIYPQTFTS